MPSPPPDVLRLLLASCALLLLAACQTAAVSPAPVESRLPRAALVDGECTEYGAVAARLDHGVVAYVKQDADYLWLCVDLPDESYATGEFVLDAPALAVPLVLHVSGQLGEWPLGNEALRPKEPDSDLWWNVRGWTAIAARFNGTEEGGEQLRFLRASGQEFQFDKRRFGPGPWTIRGDFWSVNDGEGGRVRVALDDGSGEGFALPAGRPR